MEKEKLLELLHLYFMDELNEAEKSALLNYINTNANAKNEYESIKELYKTVAENKPADVSESDLMQSRNELLHSIRKEKLKPTFSDYLNSIYDGIRFSNAKLALSSSVVLLIGFFAGYLVFNPSLQNVVDNNSNGIVSIDQVLNSGVDINNVRLLDEVSNEGNITITFQAAKPYEYTGSIEDKTVQLLLANLITKSENPGLRIQTVNKLSEKMESDFIPDAEVKRALITSIKKDDNPGVRKSAMEALLKYKYDEEIRDVLLFVLSNDQNSGLRISAINALALLKLQGIQLDSEITRELNKKVKEEQNLFIKNLAESLLKGEQL